VAAIRLTLRHRPETKYQDPSEQVRVRKGPDRIRLMSMAPERVPKPVPGGTAGNAQRAAEADQEKAL
ncbi:MAG: hypothetical protein WBG92_08165, partial [Thiohalocapsa sp.]